MSVYTPGAVGTYKPSSATVGYAPYGVTPTAYPVTGGTFGDVVSGVLTLNDSGIVIVGYDIPGRIVNKNINNEVRKSIFRGGPAVTSGADVAMFDCSNAAVLNAVVEDCVFAPDHPSAWLNCVRGDNVTVARNYIAGGCDGLDLFSNGSGVASNTVIVANVIELLGGFNPDSIGRLFSHNDPVQITDGLGIIIQGNTLLGFLDPLIGQASDPASNPNYPQMNTNSVLQLTQGSGIVTGLLFDKNWCDGGGATLNLTATGQTARNIGSITNNKFGRSSYFQGGGAGTDGVYGSGGDNSVTLLSAGGLTYSSTSGNVYEDNGHSITLRIS